MKEGPGGLPEVGLSSRTLGVRPGRDVQAINPADTVSPGAGGMSVSPDDPFHLPYIRRPPEFGGTGRDPVWELADSDLGPDLMYRPDPGKLGHGFVEPVRVVALADYQAALAATQARWRKVARPPTNGAIHGTDV
jgi:hypothetical protein